MFLSDAERIIIQARLTAAEKARHEIVTGQGVKRFVDQNGEQVEYQAANLGKLEEYIAELQGLLNPMLALRRMRRPIGFTF